MALTNYGWTGTTTGSGTLTRTLGSAIAIGDVLLCPVQSGSGTGVSVADSVNTGGWTQVPNTGQQDGVSSYYFYWFYKIANATGTPVVTLTSAGFVNNFAAGGVTGFAGTPTFDPNFTVLQTGTGVTAATTQQSNFNGEVLYAAWASTSSFFLGSPTAPWAELGSAWQNLSTGAVTSAGTNLNNSYAQNATSYWIQSLIGLYDAPRGTATLAWIK